WTVTTILEGPSSEIKSIKFSPLRLTLAVGSRDKSVWVWGASRDASQSQSQSLDFQWDCLAVLDGSRGDVKVVDFLPDDEGSIVTAGYDEVVRVWGVGDQDDGEDGQDEEGGREYYQVDTQRQRQDSTTDTTDTKEKLEKLGGARKINPWGELGMVGQGGTVWDVAVSPSGGRIFAGGGGGGGGGGGDGDGDNNDDEEGGGSICVWEKRYGSGSGVGRSRGFWAPVGRLSGAHGGREVYAVDVAGVRSGHGALASGGGDGRIVIYKEVPRGRGDE
ncbi:hypothetical protein ScalyP_jg1831, partial [Parmales sp. scaly parma]